MTTENQVCKWIQFDDDLTEFETGCEKSIIHVNRYNKVYIYCPYCGKKIEVVE
jgi:hypothetical protein